MKGISKYICLLDDWNIKVILPGGKRFAQLRCIDYWCRFGGHFAGYELSKAQPELQIAILEREFRFATDPVRS